MTPWEQCQQKAPTGTWSLAKLPRPSAPQAFTADPIEQASHHIGYGSVIHRIFSQNVTVPYQFFNHEISAIVIEVTGSEHKKVQRCTWCFHCLLFTSLMKEGSLHTGIVMADPTLDR